MLRAKRIGRRASAIQTGSGMRMVSVKQDVGRGEEIVECGPWVLLALRNTYFKGGQHTKPSLRLLHSIILSSLTDNRDDFLLLQENEEDG